MKIYRGNVPYFRIQNNFRIFKEMIRISGKRELILMSHLIEQLSLLFIRLHISMEVKHKHIFHQGGKNERERHHKIPINRLGITDSRQ